MYNMEIPYGLKEASLEMMSEFETFVSRLVSYMREIGEYEQAEAIELEIPRYERKIADLCTWLQCSGVQRLKKRP